MNPIRYPHPAEREDVIRPVPASHLANEISRLEARLRDHMAMRPDWRHLQARTVWAQDKALIEQDLLILRRQEMSRWHPVDGRTA
ncbi:hypothetical protein [Mesoterricola sediminis]|uniref:Uncharacterized protein n=1 Tax=Mesoterricola sediminis TaxID=2927980 RepID=A0AA48GRG0_9BACT|nr:hypothetical protein [Mesoterricola sediminis]BDU76239.1 hypothetical protein METESE_11970 [Mesoterricola sediminis]